MSGLIFLAIVALLVASAVGGIWLGIRSTDSSEHGYSEPLAEGLALRMELHEMAHDTRVEMIRAAHASAQQDGS